MFKCKVCDAAYDQQKKVKQHIAMKHRTKPVVKDNKMEEAPKTKDSKRKHSDGNKDENKTEEEADPKRSKRWK